MTLRLTWAGLTDVGRVRTRNEDHVALAPAHGVAVVADGMGGHPGGDVASRIAAELTARRLPELLAATLATPQDADSALDPAMTEAILEAHALVRMEAVRQPDLQGMGTTLVALLVEQDSGAYSIGHVGDSRAYLLREGVIRQLTKDDTWVQQRVDDGLIAAANVRGHPLGHLLTQCVGLVDPPTPHIHSGRAESGDTFLLCTDGLTGMLEEAEIQEILGRRSPETGAASPPEEVLRELIETAKAQGGTDNITAAMARVE